MPKNGQEVYLDLRFWGRGSIPVWYQHRLCFWKRLPDALTHSGKGSARLWKDWACSVTRVSLAATQPGLAQMTLHTQQSPPHSTATVGTSPRVSFSGEYKYSGYSRWHPSVLLLSDLQSGSTLCHGYNNLREQDSPSACQTGSPHTPPRAASSSNHPSHGVC